MAKSKKKQDDDDWRREQAMEAGMLHGIDAYNEVMGYTPTEPPCEADLREMEDHDEDEDAR